MRTPRAHQISAYRQIQDAYRAGHRRICVEIPTGGGKTVLAAMIFRSARERGKRVLFVVDALPLIDQTVRAFYEEGIYDIGVIQGRHLMTDWSKHVQIGSVQTLRRRGMPKADIVVVDECHRQDTWLKGIMASEEWRDTLFIGLSATPWSTGLGRIYTAHIKPTSIQQLIDDGGLKNYRLFAASHPDLTGVRTVRGDYHEGDLSRRMQNPALVADVVETWKGRADDRPTLVFGVDCAHAKKLEERFQQAGIPTGYVDHKTDAHEREQIRKRFHSGEIKVVCNVACLTTGVDWAVGCIVLARPTKSEMLFVQMIGRGLRVNEGIPDCLILDHSDSTLRLGLPTEIGRNELCTREKGERQAPAKKEALPKECPKCHFVKPAKVHECPECGFRPERQSKIEEAAGELVEITRERARAFAAEQQSWLSQLNFIRKERGRAEGWSGHVFKAKFGFYPPRHLDQRALAKPTEEVRRYVRSQDIRFAKRRERKAA